MTNSKGYRSHIHGVNDASRAVVFKELLSDVEAQSCQLLALYSTAAGASRISARSATAGGVADSRSRGATAAGFDSDCEECKLLLQDPLAYLH